MSKHTIYGFKVLDSVSAVTAQTSLETIVGQLDKLSYHCIFSAASSGTFTVQAKNGDKDSWYALSFGSPLTITAETEAVINLFELPFNHVRVLWSGGGTGTLTISLASKAVGA